MNEVIRWKVLQAWAATILVGVGARYGIKLTDDQAAALVVLFGSMAMKWAHNRTTPTSDPRVTRTLRLVPDFSEPEEPAQYQPPMRSNVTVHDSAKRSAE